MSISLLPDPLGNTSHVQEVTLGEGTYLLGRSRSADLMLNDPNVSRRHARLTVRGALSVIQDLGSKNGTLVNGARLTGRRTLLGGDRLTLGGHQFTLRLDAVAAEETSPDGALLDGALTEGGFIEETEWSPTSDQTERTLDLLDVLLDERSNDNRRHARALIPLVVNAVDEVLDTVGTTRPPLTQNQALRISRLIGALTDARRSSPVHLWQTIARRRLNALTQRASSLHT